MTSFETHRDLFTNHLTELHCMAAAQFRYLNPESREEAVQNTIALAWKSYRALALKNRADEPGILKSVLWYSIRQTRAGRKVDGDSRAKDAHKYASRGKAHFERVELNHLLSDDTPIPDQVSFRLDVPAFFGTALNDRQRRMAELLMQGGNTSEVATEIGVTPGRVSQFRSEFKHLFEVFMAG